MADMALHPGDHGAYRRQIDPVVAGVQPLVGLAQRRPAAGARRRLGDDALVGLLGEGSAAALAAEAAWARPRLPGPLRPVRLVALGRRQAGVARRLRRRVQPRLPLRHPRPQRQDQGVLLGLGEPAQVGRRRHPDPKPPPPDAVNGADFPPRPSADYTGDEQLHSIGSFLGGQITLSLSWISSLKLTGPSLLT